MVRGGRWDAGNSCWVWSMSAYGPEIIKSAAGDSRCRVWVGDGGNSPRGIRWAHRTGVIDEGVRGGGTCRKKRSKTGATCHAISHYGASPS